MHCLKDLLLGGKWSDEQTDEPLIADHRNFYKVEKWTKDVMTAPKPRA
jgi:hypothetical protein